MTLPKIKQMLRLRLLSMILAIFFTIMVVAFPLANQVMQWPWAESLLVATVCAVLAMVSCVGYLFLQNKLARSGL